MSVSAYQRTLSQCVSQLGLQMLRRSIFYPRAVVSFLSEVTVSFSLSERRARWKCSFGENGLLKGGFIGIRRCRRRVIAFVSGTMRSGGGSVPLLLLLLLRLEIVPSPLLQSRASFGP